MTVEGHTAVNKPALKLTDHTTFKTQQKEAYNIRHGQVESFRQPESSWIETQLGSAVLA